MLRFIVKSNLLHKFRLESYNLIKTKKCEALNNKIKQAL